MPLLSAKKMVVPFIPLKVTKKFSRKQKNPCEIKNEIH